MFSIDHALVLAFNVLSQKPGISDYKYYTMKTAKAPPTVYASFQVTSQEIVEESVTSQPVGKHGQSQEHWEEI